MLILALSALTLDARMSISQTAIVDVSQALDVLDRTELVVRKGHGMVVFLEHGHMCVVLTDLARLEMTTSGGHGRDPPPTASPPGLPLDGLGERSSIQHERVHRSRDLACVPLASIFPSFVHGPVDPDVHIFDGSLRAWKHDTQGLGKLISVLDHTPVAGKARVDCHSHQRSSRTMDATCDILPETQSPHPIVHLS